MTEVLHPPEGIVLTGRGLRFTNLRDISTGLPVEVECEVTQESLDRLALAHEAGRQAALRLRRLLGE